LISTDLSHTFIYFLSKLFRATFKVILIGIILSAMAIYFFYTLRWITLYQACCWGQFLKTYGQHKIFVSTLWNQAYKSSEKDAVYLELVGLILQYVHVAFILVFCVF